MILYIKNMVSLRCEIMVREELSKLGIGFRSVELGYATLFRPLSGVKRSRLQNSLSKIGLHLIEDRKEILAERIKNTISQILQEDGDLPKLTYSCFLSQELRMPYSYLSVVFREVVGMPIAKYMVRYRIEQAKRLLQTQDISLTEIALRLNYSSVAHLSRQFKDVTGLCVTTYKSNGWDQRIGLDQIGVSESMKQNSNPQYLIS